MDQSLPDHLAERFRWVVPPEKVCRGPGEFVLYWMHNALRAHENPALDSAICLARQNGLGLLVYHGLSDDFLHASDRLHAFILQGQRDVQRELEQRGISAVCHVQRRGVRGPFLRLLVDQAAVVISEEMPVQPLVGWVDRLAARTQTPIALVDTSCVVPVGLVGGTGVDGDRFRTAWEPWFRERVARKYIEQDAAGLKSEEPLPFQPIDLQDCGLAELIGDCNVDHSIAPVADTPGGTRAGYRRWDQVKSAGANATPNDRCDAASRCGISRMRPYLHFGMVSPFGVSREAVEAVHASGEPTLSSGDIRPTGGPEPFLDWLWEREWAFYHCFHHVDSVDSIDGLPDRIRVMMQEMQATGDGHRPGWEALSRGQTGRESWDAPQRDLIRQGELQHEAKVQWGREILSLTATPEQALRYTLDLVQRYAIGGRDPWWYHKILDSYRPADHAAVDPLEHANAAGQPSRRDETHARVSRTDRPAESTTPRVAVVGAGLAGLTAARTLTDLGLDVTVFDKSRGVGGRLATRRVGNDLAFDHGAQYFTTRDARFERFVRSWIEEGLVSPWMGRIVELAKGGKVIGEKRRVPRYVGVPGMNAIAKHLAEGLSVQLGTRIERLRRDENERWTLIDERETRWGCFDTVLCNSPPVQVAQLVGGQASWTPRLSEFKMNPCIAMMLQCDGLAETPWAGVFVNEGPIAWMARNDAKPGRSPVPGSVWTVHASAPWSITHLDDADDVLEHEMIQAIESVVGRSIGTVGHRRVHRWRYSIPDAPSQLEFLWDRTSQLGACGDWLSGGRIEGAFLSGQAIAGAVMREITIDRAMGENFRRKATMRE